MDPITPEVARFGLATVAKLARRRTALALAALAASVLFLKIDDLARVRHEWAALWWLFFLGGLCWTGADALAAAWKTGVVYLTAKMENQTRRRLLRSLTRAEQLLLLHFFTRETSSGYFDIHDGVINGLAAKGIVFRASNFGTSGFYFPFNIQPWARDYLARHRELLRVN